MRTGNFQRSGFLVHPLWHKQDDRAVQQHYKQLSKELRRLAKLKKASRK